MTEQAADSSNAPHAFFDALLAEGASPALPLEQQIFAPFIGSWHLTVRWFDAAGRMTREEPAEWHFSRVLEGRAVQDVWIVPPRGRRGRGADYEYGTSLRFHDSGIEGWRSLWIGPMQRVVRMFVARRIGDRIVLETNSGDEPPMRWSFSEVGEHSFLWTNEIQENGIWRTQQTFEAKRQLESGG